MTGNQLGISPSCCWTMLVIGPEKDLAMINADQGYDNGTIVYTTKPVE